MEFKIYSNVDRIPCEGRREVDVIGVGRNLEETQGFKKSRGRKVSRRRRALLRKRRRICMGIALLLVCGVWFSVKSPDLLQMGGSRVHQFLSSVRGEEYPKELLEMLEKNEEAYDFVTNYPERETYLEKEIDISGICKKGEAPLLLQWDLRWGYDNYGDSMIGIAGCGPTCMTMAYLCLTGDTSMNPRKMADYATEKGYHTEVGTSWSFFTQGASNLGLSGQELPLSESAMKQALDQGSVIISSMRPGDFTTTGHFILIRGYDEKGFLVNDPNSRKNSEKQWDYETLSGQIKGLWEIGT